MRARTTGAVGILIPVAPRDSPCFPVPAAPLRLGFFPEPASASPGGLCRSHRGQDEAADGVPWGPISDAHKLARWALL